MAASLPLLDPHLRPGIASKQMYTSISSRSLVSIRSSRTWHATRFPYSQTTRASAEGRPFPLISVKQLNDLRPYVAPLALCCALTCIATPTLAQLPSFQGAVSCEVHEERRLHAPLAFSFSSIFGNDEDSVDPFTLYGKTLKKYLIENIEDGRIVSRAKGFTVDTCIGIQPEFLETPQFRGLSSTEKEAYSEERTCIHATGSDLKETCNKACEGSCQKVLMSYAHDVRSEQGLKIGEKLEQTLLRRCIRQCNYECGKPGKISDFYIPSRN